MKTISTRIMVAEEGCIIIIPIDSEFEKEKERYKDMQDTMVIIV